MDSYGEEFSFYRTFQLCTEAESEKTTPLCYGVAIAVGTLTVMAQKLLFNYFKFIAII